MMKQQAIRILSVICLSMVACLPTLAQEQTWRMKAKNADINEWVAQVAEITGKTFVVDPRLKGNVTVISDTPMDKEGVYALFLSVLRLHNFTAVPSGDVIRIQQNATGKQTPGTRGDLGAVAPEELVTRVIAAQNVDSAELVKILRPLIPQYGHIASVAEPNVVIISDHADNIIRLKQIIANIDVSDENQVVMVPLKDAWVGTVVAVLEKVAPEQIGRGSKGPQRVQVIANERNNSLVVRGKPRPVAEVLKIVDKLDQPATTAGATQVIPLSYADATNVATILNGIISGETASEEGAATQQTNIQADESLNAIVARAEPSAMSEILEVIKQLDVRRAQVMIEAAIVEVTIDDSLNLGVDTAAGDADGSTVPFITTPLTGALTTLFGSVDDGTFDMINALAGAQALSPTSTLAAAKINADGFSFGAVVTALAGHSHANLLSTPSIMTLDNQEAHILVGREVPFRTGSFTTTGDGTSNPFTTVQREDVGVELTVTPHVHDSSSVRLEIAQQITNITEAPAEAADIVTSKRSIETTILAEDQQTIVLGGLIQDDIVRSSNKVPLLGDIPLLGNLFKSRANTKVKTNLLVFLKPTVIRTLEDSAAVTRDKYKTVWEVEINTPDADIDTAIDALYDGERPQ